MKIPALGACLVAVFAVHGAACGGGGKPQLLDSSVDALFACDPVKQTGCKAGEKCTWIVDIDGTATMDEIGHVGCAAVGASATQDGAACAEASVQNNMPVDTCVAGDLCISGKCKPICDPQLVDGAAAGACATSYACSIYSGVFTSGMDAVAGVCEPTCDPLTQKLNVGTTGVDACGSTDPTNPTATCVPSGGFRSFHCAPFNADFAPPGTTQKWIERTDRQPPLTDSRGDFFGNGCAPGFIPFYVEDAAAGAMTTLCSGMCAPLKVDSTIALDPAHANDNQGDINALAKLPSEAAPQAGNAVCATGKKGSAVSSVHGEDCRYVWFPLAHGDPTMALQTPFNDKLGICFPYEKFLTVRLPGMTQLFPEKSCADLPATTTDPKDPYGTAKEAGCYPLSESRLFVHQRPRSALTNFRFAYGPGTVVRHIFE
jgi:hypothetical protein